MRKLNKKELSSISGGISLKSKFIILGGIITFIIGIIDGFTRVKKCNS